MNFQEFLDKLPIEDRQFAIDHFVKNILGQAPSEKVVIRRTAKISTLGTEEEMLQEISQAFNIPIEELRNQNIGEKLKEITSDYHLTSSIITKYKDFLTSQNATKDKFEELDDLGKFLVALKVNCTIEIPNKPSVIPDFIISVNNKRIGIEHTRVMNTNSQVLLKTVAHILKKAENILLNRNSELKQIVNISINYWKVNINGKALSDKLSIQDKGQVANIIADYVEGLLTNKELTQPEFIDRVSISDRSVHPLNLILNENYIAKPEFKNLFELRIKSKESKLDSYLKNNSLDELWLLAIISGVTASSSFILKEQKQLDSLFDKIYLFDNFSKECLTVHSKT